MFKSLCLIGTLLSISFFAAPAEVVNKTAWEYTCVTIKRLRSKMYFSNGAFVFLKILKNNRNSRSPTESAVVALLTRIQMGQ